LHCYQPDNDGYTQAETSLPHLPKPGRPRTKRPCTTWYAGSLTQDSLRVLALPTSDPEPVYPRLLTSGHFWRFLVSAAT